jgi:peptide deformylase
MAILKVLQYGDPRLRQPAEKVHKMSSKIQKLIRDMFDTMYAQNGCGLAATQVGVAKRIFVLDCSTDEQQLPQMVFINPVIVKMDGACVSREGCLSFPDVFTDVRRYDTVTVRYMDYQGRRCEMTVEGGSLLCRAIQHELDHLDGIVFVDHAIDEAFTNGELAAHNLPSIDDARKIPEPELAQALAERLTAQPPEATSDVA